MTLLSHEGQRRKILPLAIPSSSTSSAKSRFKNFSWERNLVEVQGIEEEDVKWEARAESLAEKQKRLTELDKEKQEDPSIDIENLEDLYGEDEQV